MRAFIIIILAIGIRSAMQGQVGINTTNPHASAIMDMTSTSKGLLIPRMTLAQRNAIGTPAVGLTIYQTTGTIGYYYFTGATWRKIDVPSSLLADNDADTWINVEKNPDEDKIRFALAGAEFMRMEKNINNQFSIYVNSALNNTYFGISAGAANLIGMNNTALGDSSLRLATSSNNTAVGQRSLSGLTTGNNNTAVGMRALQNNTVGDHNTAVGNRALLSGTGSDNTAIGYSAMGGQVLSLNNVAIGLFALNANGIGLRNVAIGYRAMSSNTNGSDNTAIGFQSMRTGTGNRNTLIGNYTLQNFNSGSDNTAVGYKALMSLITGSFNTAVGTYALEDLQQGSHNTAAGIFALKNVTTGSHNTALGNGALSQGEIISYNSALGKGALQNTHNGEYNTAIGFEALRANTSGDYNTAVGYQALITNTTGSHNTGIGSLSDVGASNLTNSTAIGARSYVNKSNTLILGAVEGVNGATESTRVTLNQYTIRDGTVLDLFGFQKGFLLPRMTEGQKNAIANPANGLMIYNTTTHSPWIFNGQLWEDFNLPVGHLGASEGDGLTFFDYVYTPGFAPAIRDNDNDSRVEVNVTAPFDNGGSTRVVLNNTEVFKLTTTSPQYYSKLEFGSQDLSLYFGENAGLNHMFGNYNVGIGKGALQFFTQGEHNIAIGTFALKNGDLNGENIAIGNNALLNLDGSIGFNIAIGNAALSDDLQADSCIAIGYHAMNTYTSNSRNIGIGALTEVEGVNSVAIGARAKAVGDNNIVLGSINGVNGATADTKVGIGDTSPEAMLHVKDDFCILQLEDSTSSNIRIRYNIDGGDSWDIVATGDASTPNAKVDFEIGTDPYVMSIKGNGDVNVYGNFTDASDLRMKKDLLPLSSSLDKIKMLNGYHYCWKDKNKSRALQTGVIAQEVKTEFPDLVREDKQTLHVNYNGLTAVLLDAIKEMSTKVTEQEEMIQALDMELAKLEKE